MSIDKYRHIEDGLYECLNCYYQWEFRKSPRIAGWSFCPHCGTQWEGEQVCSNRKRTLEQILHEREMKRAVEDKASRPAWLILRTHKSSDWNPDWGPIKPEGAIALLRSGWTAQEALTELAACRFYYGRYIWGIETGKAKFGHRERKVDIDHSGWRY